MARREASGIAQEVVSLSNQSTDNLAEISRLDQEKKYSEALDLISREIERNRQAREKAIKLSSQLELMAKNISGISPASASQVALQAVSSETTLISRLIEYNDYLNQLLEILREKFMGLSNGNSIPELISKINDEAKAINDLDKKFNDLIGDFDSF
jgi:ABC-type transporter Mla subunit MlaD